MMKRMIIPLIMILLSLPLSHAQENVTEYIPPTVVYLNRTCPFNEELDRAMCIDVRVLVNILNITENRTSFKGDFSLFGKVSSLDCKLRDIGEESEYGRCYYDFPSEIWYDMLTYRVVPMPMGEIEKSENYWNKTLQDCQATSRFRGGVIFWGVIAVAVSSIIIVIYLRWKKFGVVGR